MGIETYGFIQELDNLDIEKDIDKGSFKKLFKDYEEVIVKSLITSFGLDFILIKDRHGGDVDTIHNVRAIQKGEDKRFDGYANKNNQKEYENITPYSTKNEKGQRIIADKYHSHANYKERNRIASEQKKDGNLFDTYSGNKIPQNGKVDLDHTISAKEIHEDAGRVLAGIDGVEIANRETNLNHTDRSINRPKGAKSVDQFLNDLKREEEKRKSTIAELKNKTELTDKEKAQLNKLEKLSSINEKKIKEADEKARAAYEMEINSKYYSSKRFINDTLKASYQKGMQMGIRQALGTILAATWMCIREELPKLVIKMKNNFELGEFFKGIAEIVKKSFQRVREQYKEIIQSFHNGALAGIMSSLVTTITNIFFTTSKNVVKIIRESWASIVEALNILLFNPNNLPFGDVLRAVSKIIATASAVILGTAVNEAISKLPVSNIPIIGEVLPIFTGTLVTGLMSVSLLYFLDHSKMVQKLVDWANKLKTELDYKIEYYQKVYTELVKYAAELADINFESFEQQIQSIQSINSQLQQSSSVGEMNSILTKLVRENDISLPYDGTISGLDKFMSDKNAVLTFKL